MTSCSHSKTGQYLKTQPKFKVQKWKHISADVAKSALHDLEALSIWRVVKWTPPTTHAPPVLPRAPDSHPPHVRAPRRARLPDPLTPCHPSKVTESHSFRPLLYCRLDSLHHFSTLDPSILSLSLFALTSFLIHLSQFFLSIHSLYVYRLRSPCSGSLGKYAP